MGDGSKQGKPWEERLNDAGSRFEEELKRVVRYIDAEVVPEVRHHGSIALRSAAAQLQKLAEHMDNSHPPTQQTQQAQQAQQNGADAGSTGDGTSA